jgi:hypothetical protein
VEAAGDLRRLEKVPGQTVLLEGNIEVDTGYEIRDLGYDLGRDDSVKSHRFVLDTGDVTGLTEVAFRGPAAGGAWDRSEAVWPNAGDDPVAVATAYLEGRLGLVPANVRLADDGGTETRLVDWDGGGVTLRRWAEWWYVIESIGASISFEQIQLTHDEGDSVAVQVFVGEPGVVDVLIVGDNGEVCAQDQRQVEERGPAAISVAYGNGCSPVAVRAHLGDQLAERRI